MQESIVFLVRVQCRRKESSRSLSHLLMSFLFYLTDSYVSLSFFVDREADKNISHVRCLDIFYTLKGQNLHNAHLT